MRLSAHPDLVVLVVSVGLARGQHFLLVHGVGVALPVHSLSTLARVLVPALH